jgi:uncharacterized MAPEG superfamily protein
MNMSIPVWALLVFAMWTIATLMLGVGVYRWSLVLTGKAELKSFPGDEPHGSPFYRRAVRAHANCVENLPVFAAIVLAAQAAGLHSATLDVLSVGVIAARGRADERASRFRLQRGHCRARHLLLSPTRRVRVDGCTHCGPCGREMNGGTARDGLLVAL